MICSIHQPNFLPYPGFFDKVSKSGIFILYDSAQFTKNGWQNRNRICTGDKWEWLTVPIKHRNEQKILEVEIHNPERSLKKIWSTLRTVYGNSPYFDVCISVLEKCWNKEHKNLSDFNSELIISIAEAMELETTFIMSSHLSSRTYTGTEAIIELCKAVDANIYISGISGRNYIDEALFNEANIKIMYQEYECPVYKQFNSNSFQPNMSIIDVMFNCGPESMDVISGKIKRSR